MTQPSSQPDDSAAVNRKVKLTATQLAAQMPEGWQGDQLLIWREWSFETYLDGVNFAERVAQQAESVNHHPDLLIRYKKVRVSYSTHDAGGVTALDVAEAASLTELR
jgi:4a-hydroxytetrahydrobiopterin dehydratase